MQRIIDSVRPFWRGVLLALALLELPRWALVWFGAPVNAIANPLRVVPAPALLQDSALVVRFAPGESAELPVLVTAQVDGHEPAYTLHALSTVVRDRMDRRNPEILQLRAGGGLHASGLAGAHTRVALTLRSDGSVEALTTMICPPERSVYLGGPVDGPHNVVQRSRADTRSPESVSDAVDRALTAAARATCRVDQSLQPDEVTRVTSPVSEVRVALGSPQAVICAFPIHFHRTATDTVLNLRVYRIADTTIAKLTPLGIEGVRPGTTTIEGRSWTRDANGEEHGGAAAVAVPLIVTK